MITPRRSDERGRADLGWLEARHTFSFADYHDPRFMRFGPLRVLNEDRIRGGQGFPPHPHRDMEIVTYVIDGAIRHEDDMGNGSVVNAGEVQLMSAGSGVVHSEHNAHPDDELHLLQMWVFPSARGATPRYEQRRFELDVGNGPLRLIVSPDGRDGSLTIGQDVQLLAGRLDAGATVHHDVKHDASAWLQVVRGSVDLEDVTLAAGDGAGIEGEALRLRAREPSEIILWHFDESSHPDTRRSS